MTHRQAVSGAGDSEMYINTSQNTTFARNISSFTHIENMSSDPSKTHGQLESTTGSVKESMGKMTGSTGMQESGKEQHARGEAEITQAKAQGYAEGTKERVAGAKDSVLGAVKGDEAQKAQGNVRGDVGSTQQDVNRNL